MNYSFPPTKFTKINSLEKQIIHVISEIEEFKKEINFKITSDGQLTIESCLYCKMFEEALDLYHSLESLVRVGERDGYIDANNLKLKTYRKNYKRGYYE